MKRYLFMFTVTVLALTLVASESPAQRRGGGGGGLGGGGARPSANRSPSLSRPSAPSAGKRPATPAKPATRPALPSRPAAGQKPATKPGAGKLPSAGQKPATRPGAGKLPSTRPNLPAAGTRPSIDRDKIKDSIKPGQRPSTPDWFKPGGAPPTASTLPARPGAGERPGKLPGLKPPGDRPVATPPIADGRPGTRPPGVRPPTRPPAMRPPAGHPPRPWYPDHPNYKSSDRWWKWATATAVTGWVVHRWTNPVYYRYGTGGNVYYDNNVVYVDGQQYGSADQYYTEASSIAAAVPETAEDNADDWMPLGVFALTKEGVNATSMYLQLAVRKDGMIAGTFYNESTNVTHPVEGMVDEKTQRAVWKAADGTNPDLIMETGIYNLSEDTANVLVHFGPEETQMALLVRLEESEAPQE